MGTQGYQLVETRGEPEVWRRVDAMHAGHATRNDYEFVSPPFVDGEPPPPWLWVRGNASVAEAPDVEQGMAITLHWQSNVDHFQLSVYRDGECIRSLEHCREMEPAWLNIEGERQPWEARFLLDEVDRVDLSPEQNDALDAALSSGDWSGVRDLVDPTPWSWEALADSLGAVRVPDDRIANQPGPQSGVVKRLLQWFGVA